MSRHQTASASNAAIVLVAFGSRESKAQRAFRVMGQATRARFPSYPVRWAFTSSMIRRKWAEAGHPVDSPSMALARLRDEGVTHVAVQSLHTIAGREFDELQQEIHQCQQGPGMCFRISLGQPLLASLQDLRLAVAVLMTHVPKARRPDEPVIVMGHGTEQHPAELAYVAAAAEFQRLDPRVFLATVEGQPAFTTVLKQLPRSGARRVWLVPFMAMAGNHVIQDMNGPAADSWTSQLTRRGFTPRPVLKGTAEYVGIQDIWLNHLADAIRRGKQENEHQRT